MPPPPPPSPPADPPPPPPLILRTEDLDPAALAWLSARCRVLAVAPDDRPALLAHLAHADALIVRTYTRVDAPLLDAAPRLRVVARAGVGLDNIDLPACHARGIRVLHTPDANSDAVAEFVFSLLFHALRPVRFLDAPLDLPAWQALRKAAIAPRQLRELTLGILGLGKIGTRVARIARAFSMRVLYHDLLDLPADRRHGAEPVPRDALLRESDVLSIHVDPRPENRHLINAAALALLKPNAILLNTSRGLIIDHAALAHFLRAHPAALALLDVHDPEPIDAANPLLGLTNARLSPHLAAATSLAHANMSWVVREVWEELRGERAG